MSLGLRFFSGVSGELSLNVYTLRYGIKADYKQELFYNGAFFLIFGVFVQKIYVKSEAEPWL